MTKTPNTDLAVRRLRHDDLEGLLELYRHLHDDDVARVDSAQLDRVWNEILRDDRLIYLGGFIADQLVAACNAAIISNLTRGARPYAVVENVVTHAAHRRLGAGTKVMNELIAQCRARNCYKIMLMSALTRAQVHVFYESLGFDRRAKQAFVLNLSR